MPRRRAPACSSTADLLILIAVALSAIGYAEGGALARELGGWRVICWAVLLSAPLTIPIALVAAAGSDVHADADAWLGFAYVAGVSALLGFFPWYAGLARGGVAKIGQVQLVQPLLTLAWSAALLGRAREPNYAICGSPRRPLRRRHAADAGRSGSTGNVATVSDVAALNHLSSGKVRDIYAVGEDRLLLVASDRISTYDVVHPTPIPDKGKLLTGLTAFWLERTGEVCPNHLISFTEVPEEFRGRAMLVERLEMVPVECVVRGYITGSGWKDYQATGAVCGIELPDGLRESEQLPEPIFTPATKAEVGDHDENVDFDRAAEIVGDRELLEELRRLSIAIYELGAAHARERGIILADTKFEFGRRAGRDDRARRRGDDPRLLALLAGRRLRARPRPAELRQAVRARLGRGLRLGQDAARAGAPRRRDRAHARALRRRVRAHHRRALHGLAGTLGVRARVLIRPKAGILDPQGQAVERALPALGFEGVANVHVGRLIELDVEDASQVPQMCERLLANPLIEDYEVVELEDARREVRRGALPRLLRRGRRAAWRAAASPRPSCSGTATATSAASTPWSCPGGFSYGDYLRVGAIARFSPMMESVIEFARDGGPVLGICNGFQVLCEAGLLPGALLPNDSLRFVCRQVEVVVENPDTPFTRACAQGELLSIPVKHTTGRYYAPPGTLPEEQVVLRYAPGHNPNGSMDDVAGVCNEAGNVMGLMPHPEHAVDPLTGSSDGGRLFESLAMVPA